MKNFVMFLILAGFVAFLIFAINGCIGPEVVVGP